MIYNNINRIEHAGILALTLQDLGGNPALQRSKTEYLCSIASQNKMYESIAQPAYAIIKEDVGCH